MPKRSRPDLPPIVLHVRISGVPPSPDVIKQHLVPHVLSSAEFERMEWLQEVLWILPDAQINWQAEHDALMARVTAYNETLAAEKRARRKSPKRAAARGDSTEVHA